MWQSEALHKTRDLKVVEAVLECLLQPAALLTDKGLIACANLPFRTLLSLEQAAPERVNFASFFEVADQRRILALLAQPSAAVQTDLKLAAPHGSQPPMRLDFMRLSAMDDELGVVCLLAPTDRQAQSPTLRYLMENLDQGVWDYNLQTGAFIASKTWFQLRGETRFRTIDMSSDSWLSKIHPEDRDQLAEALYGTRRGDTKNIVVEYRHRHADGHWLRILCRASVTDIDPEGKPLRIVGTDTDITEATESQDSVKRLAGKLQLAVEASGMGIWEFNPATKMVHWDDRMLEIYGITDGQNERRDNLWETHLHPDDYEEAVAYARECTRLKADFRRDYRIVRPDGEVRHIRSLARTVSVPDGPEKLIGVNIDVTEDYDRAEELELARQRLEYESLHDALTGLGNRRGLDRAALTLFGRVTPACSYAAMNIDLDHFKEVNDRLGHSAGDFVLKKAGSLISRIIGALGTPFRVGGDEFAVLFETAPDEETLQDLSMAIIDEMCAPIQFEGETCQIGASIGFATGQGAPESASELFIRADTALYAAKRAGRNCYRAYTEAVAKTFHFYSDMQQDLKDALSTDQILCHLQPQFDAETLQIVSAEALIRWHCPKRGVLAPAEFLPEAAKAGLLSALDRRVFNLVCGMQTDWAARGIGFVTVFVNLSKARLEDDALVAQTTQVLKPHHRLGFEVLETTLLDSPSTSISFKIDTLRDAGVKIAMDDFGTGRSSVKALQALRPDVVKIDRSLVASVGERAQQVEVLQNLARISRLEGAQIVVEGLETGAHLAAIRAVDCDVLQGYVLHRPMTALEFEALLCRSLNGGDDLSTRPAV